VGLGTILGSNVFNGLFTVGVASGITPIVAGLAEVIPALVRGVAAVAPTYPPRSGIIERRRVLMLLAMFAVYLVVVLRGSSE
jgi:cation:H+ antiporter